MMHPPVVLWYEPEGATPSVTENDFAVCCKTLGAAGFDRISCKNASQLLSKAGLLAGRHAKMPATARPRLFAVLCGNMAENVSLAHLLRAESPLIGIMACIPDLDEETQMLALQSGIDMYFVPQASDRLVIAQVFSLLRRMAGLNPTQATLAGAQVWHFVENAWKIVTPRGEAVALTTAERAFLLELTSATDRCATHEQLLKASGVFLSTEPEVVRRERLSVMISRLRKKFQALQIDLPVRSLHGTGYMFVGAMT